MSPESGAGQTGDFGVTVYFTDCSLWKFMEAVRSLFGMRGSEWSWRRVTGPDGQYCYNLGRTINGSGLDSAIRDEIQRDFEEALKTRLRGLMQTKRIVAN